MAKPVPALFLLATPWTENSVTGPTPYSDQLLPSVAVQPLASGKTSLRLSYQMMNVMRPE